MLKFIGAIKGETVPEMPKEDLILPKPTTRRPPMSTVGEAKDYSLSRVLSKFKEIRTTKAVVDLDHLYIRASGLYKMCPRETVLMAHEKVEKVEKIEARTGAYFSFGSNTHVWLQNEVFVDVILGHWKCIHCGKEIGSGRELYPKPDECPHCKNTDFVYKEIYLYDEVLHLGGHMDGFAEQAKDLQIIDFKTINAEGYDNLEKWGTSDGYIVQANAYMLLTGLDTLRMVFVNKNDSTFKERIIRRSDKIIDRIEEKCMETVNGISRIGVTNQIPDRRSCKSSGDSRAKTCPVKDICFRLSGENAVYTK